MEGNNQEIEESIEVLDIFKFGNYCPEGNFEVVDNVSLANKGIKKIDNLGAAKALRKLNLSFNKLKEYKIKIIKGLNGLVNLKALILGHNKIQVIQNLESLQNLNTLILSENRIKQIQNIGFLKNLKKLSLSHNHISEMKGFEGLYKLDELRLNDNKILKIGNSLKETILLKLLDLGNNFILQDEIPNLAHLQYLRNLNVKGNKKIEAKTSFEEKIKLHCTHLQILNNVKLAKNTNSTTPPIETKSKSKAEIKTKVKPNEKEKKNKKITSNKMPELQKRKKNEKQSLNLDKKRKKKEISEEINRKKSEDEESDLEQILKKKKTHSQQATTIVQKYSQIIQKTNKNISGVKQVTRNPKLKNKKPTNANPQNQLKQLTQMGIMESKWESDD